MTQKTLSWIGAVVCLVALLLAGWPPIRNSRASKNEIGDLQMAMWSWQAKSDSPSSNSFSQQPTRDYLEHTQLWSIVAAALAAAALLAAIRAGRGQRPAARASFGISIAGLLVVTARFATLPSGIDHRIPTQDRQIAIGLLIAWAAALLLHGFALLHKPKPDKPRLITHRNA